MSTTKLNGNPHRQRNPAAPITLSAVIEIPYRQLQADRGNVREAKPDKTADAALKANIKATGVVLENLIVAPVEGAKDEYAVKAGNRRYRAVGALVKEGVFEDGFLLPCRVMTAGSETAVALAENVLRVPMHPADEFMAYQRMLNDGLTEAAIAAQFGVPKQRVRQRLKLAQVATRIVKAYRRGVIDLETVMAFTLAESKKRQLEVYAKLGERCSAWPVKQAFTKGGERSDGRLATFVTLDAYTKVMFPHNSGHGVKLPARTVSVFCAR